LINNKDTTTVDFLIAYLKQEQDEMALSMILNRLCEFHDERIRKYMKTLVSSPNSYARQAAIEALSTYGEAEHATIKNAYLTDQSKHIQIIAARYLVTIYNDQEPIVFLRKVAVSNDLDDRLFALGILAQVNDQVALQALIAEYATANASTAKSLMQYIGQFPRTQPVTQFLLKSLNDIPELRDQALQCLQAHHRTTPADLVIPLLAGGSPQVAQNALRALYGTDNDRVIQLAIKLSHDDSIEITCSAIRLLATVPQSLTIADTLIELLNHRSSNVREQAVLALLHYKLPASRIALMNRVEIESSTRVSNALRKALAELQ
jgi:HEAT repeat protein